MVVSELDSLREDFEGCNMLAFADLSTQMILVTDSKTNLPREALDALCAEAALLLGDGKSPDMGTALRGRAVTTNGKEIRVFLRADNEPSDVLCCVCAATLDLGAFLDDAQTCLHRISGDAD